MASYDGATLKVTELFSTGHSTANVCQWRLHGFVLNFIHLSAMAVAEIAKSTHLKGCPHSFVYIVYSRKMVIIINIRVNAKKLFGHFIKYRLDI